MFCERCGVSAAFDARLPYVNQTVSFDTGHDCVTQHRRAEKQPAQ
jgi:hypothetical protein